MKETSEKKLSDRVNFYVFNLDRAVDRMERYDAALFQGRVGIREATVFPNCMPLNEYSRHSTISNKIKRHLKLWHNVFWTCRLCRLWVRIVRYSLQIFRIFRRRFFNG